LALLSSSLVF